MRSFSNLSDVSLTDNANSNQNRQTAPSGSLSAMAGLIGDRVPSRPASTSVLANNREHNNSSADAERSSNDTLFNPSDNHTMPLSQMDLDLERGDNADDSYDYGYEYDDETGSDDNYSAEHEYSDGARLANPESNDNNNGKDTWLKTMTSWVPFLNPNQPSRPNGPLVGAYDNDMQELPRPVSLPSHLTPGNARRFKGIFWHRKYRVR